MKINKIKDCMLNNLFVIVKKKILIIIVKEFNLIKI